MRLIAAAASLLVLASVFLIPGAVADTCFPTVVTHPDTCARVDHHGCAQYTYPKCETHCVSWSVNPTLPSTWIGATSCVPGARKLLVDVHVPDGS